MTPRSFYSILTFCLFSRTLSANQITEMITVVEDEDDLGRGSDLSTALDYGKVHLHVMIQPLKMIITITMGGSKCF